MPSASASRPKHEWEVDWKRKTDRCITAEIKNKLEGIKLDVVTKVLEKEKLYHEFSVNREKRLLAKGVEKMKKQTSGRCAAAEAPEGPNDNTQKQSEYFKSQNTISEKRLQKWKHKEKQVEKEKIAFNEEFGILPWEKNTNEELKFGQSFQIVMGLMGYNPGNVESIITRHKQVQETQKQVEDTKPIVYTDLSMTPRESSITKDVFECLRKEQREDGDGMSEDEDDKSNIQVRKHRTTQECMLKSQSFSAFGESMDFSVRQWEKDLTRQYAESFKMKPQSPDKRRAFMRVQSAPTSTSRMPQPFPGQSSHTAWGQDQDQDMEHNRAQSLNSFVPRSTMRPQSASLPLTRPSLKPQPLKAVYTTEELDLTEGRLQGTFPVKTLSSDQMPVGRDSETQPQPLSALPIDESEEDKVDMSDLEPMQSSKLRSKSCVSFNLDVMVNDNDELEGKHGAKGSQEHKGRQRRTGMVQPVSIQRPASGKGASTGGESHSHSGKLNGDNTRNSRPTSSGPANSHSNNHVNNRVSANATAKVNGKTRRKSSVHINGEEKRPASGDYKRKVSGTINSKDQAQISSQSQGRRPSYLYGQYKDRPAEDNAHNLDGTPRTRLPQWKRDLMTEAPPSCQGAKGVEKVRLVMSKSQRRRELQKMVEDKVTDVKTIVQQEQARRIESRTNVFMTMLKVQQAMGTWSSKTQEAKQAREANGTSEEGRD